MAEVTFEETNAGGQASDPGAAAWAASRLGLRVFPLVPGTGLPALKAWPDYATADEAQIREWWTWEYPGYGVGIACGPESGVWVLDIDVKHGVDGFATLSRLAGMHHAFGFEGLSFALNTMVVSTPSGGAHLYFAWAEGVANSTGDTNRLGPGLDVRADRGYVRGPGWNGYAVVPRGPERTRVTSVKAAPGWLVELAQKRTRDFADDAAAPGTSWARFSASKTIRTLESAPEGSRNVALNKAAYKLGLSGVATQEEAWKSCQGALIGMGAGDDMPAWRRTFESGWNAGVAKRGSA